jgi:antitoxin ParD1/3/4
MFMRDHKKIEKVSITLPAIMLQEIREKVRQGAYASTSEVVREAMRMWQRKEQEHEECIAVIRARLEDAASSGVPIALDDAFAAIDALHAQHLQA